MKIAVLLGGTSSERDVSISSGIAIAKALQNLGHKVIAVDCAFGDQQIDINAINPLGLVKQTPSDIEKRQKELNRNLFKTIDFLLAEKIDLVFNALHGGYGENGQLQALLELADIPFTGSGSVASALGMDKHLSKIFFRAHNVPTADWLYLTRGDAVDLDKIANLGMPLVVKPNSQGSTVGLTILHDMAGLNKALELAFEHDDAVLIETFIPGREITVGIVHDRALPIVEIVPKSGFYDYESKYQSGKTDYFCPADIPEELTAAIQASAMTVFKAIGCRGYARVDYRLTESGDYYCLEINTLPGMTATSLVPKAAKAAGLSFEELLNTILNTVRLR
jgi:D-alanine-D-alanine ligase